MRILIVFVLWLIALNSKAAFYSNLATTNAAPPYVLWTNGGATNLTLWGSAGGTNYTTTGPNGWLNTNTITRGSVHISSGNQTNSGLLQIGTGSGAAVQDAGVLVNRAVDNTVVGHAHSFSDNSIISRTNMGTYGYNSYDVFTEFVGTGNMEHEASFQVRPNWNRAGTLTYLYDYYTQPVMNQGTISTRYGLYVGDVSKNGGTLSKQYGVYLNTLTNAVENWGIYANSPASNYFSGSVGIGGTPTDKLNILTETNLGGERFAFSMGSSDFGNTVGDACSIGWRYHGNGSPVLGKLSGIVNNYAGQGALDLAFITYGATTVSERMRLTGPGNLGIGTTNVSEKLTVAGNISASGAGYFTNGVNSYAGIISTGIVHRFSSGSADTLLVTNGNVIINGTLTVSNGLVAPTAQFSSTTNIPLTAASTAYPITFDRTDFNNKRGIGLGIGTNGLHSRMWITNSGVYEFTPSLMLNFNANDLVRMWFMQDGTNITASATAIRGQNGSIRVMTVPFMINVASGPTAIEIFAASESTGEYIYSETASGIYPAAPSVICPIKRVSAYIAP